MRIFVASAGDQPYHRAQREVFGELARIDTVGKHMLEDDPARADALLFVDLQQHPDDPFLRALRQHGLVRRHREKVFVYDERDQPFFTFPGIYISATAGSARARAIAGGPYATLLTQIPRSDQAPDLLYSFQGARTHPIRDAVLELSHPGAIVRDTTHINFFGPPSPTGDPLREAASAEYAQLVRRSKFVLCPRGQGPSSFRIYETLGAARVPVIISDHWLPPQRIDWCRCVVRIPEKELARIPATLKRLEPQWPEMVAAGQRAVREELARDRLWHHYAESLVGLAQARRRLIGVWWAQEQVLRLAFRRARGAVGEQLRSAGGADRARSTRQPIG